MANREVGKTLMALAVLLAVGGGCGWWLLEWRWEDILSPARAVGGYEVARHDDDTLRVVMIGDSWAGMHSETLCDTLLQGWLARLTGASVRVESNGRGGAKSKEVYGLMFRATAPAEEQRLGRCTQQQLQRGADYCIVMAGINDAAACLGTRYYCENYRLIIDFLLAAGIRPVVVEMPRVDIAGLYGGKPLKDRAVDWLRSAMTDCRMYDVAPYGQRLLAMLDEQGLADSVVLVRKEQWNADGVADQRGLYLPDGIHLNARGYGVLDSCLATAIADDLRKLKNNSTF